jgi:hypothetical protein
MGFENLEVWKRSARLSAILFETNPKENEALVVTYLLSLILVPNQRGV